MLMTVVIVFFTCNLLALIVNILEVFQIEIILLCHISNLMITLNSSVNFVIYCIFGEKFKKIFYQLCSCTNQSTASDNVQAQRFVSKTAVDAFTFKAAYSTNADVAMI